jgi:hypothetical protein
LLKAAHQAGKVGRLMGGAFAVPASFSAIAPTGVFAINTLNLQEF